MAPTQPNNPAYNLAKSVHEFRVANLQGEHIKLDVYKGHMCIIVNTASKSDFTKVHYNQFNELMEKYGESQGLRILAFPCNQFNGEEPLTTAEIAKHAEENKVKFDIFDKVDVNGDDAIPLYKFLKCKLPDPKAGGVIKSNYTKFLVNKIGLPVERCGPEILPKDMEKMISPFFTGPIN